MHEAKRHGAKRLRVRGFATQFRCPLNAIELFRSSRLRGEHFRALSTSDSFGASIFEPFRREEASERGFSRFFEPPAAKTLPDPPVISAQLLNRFLNLRKLFRQQEQSLFCLVFEPLGESLCSLLARNSFRGFWMEDLQAFAKQCLTALTFLHITLRVVHTDLKPENIILLSTAWPEIAAFPRDC